LIFLLGCIMAFAFNPSLINRIGEEWTLVKLSMTYSGLMWVLFWKGNSYLVDFWNKRISWLEEPSKRFIVGVITVLVYTPLVIVGLNTSFKLLSGVSTNWGGVDVLISIGITFFITFFMFAKNFLDNWRKASLDTERIKREQMSSKYESLKNQVNPHFLFNTLNNLYALALKKSDKTPEVIAKLSEILDYILYQCKGNFVPLKNEIALLHNYIALEKIRYGDRVDIVFNEDIKSDQKTAPLLLLTFLENAFKHGVSQELNTAKIRIDITADDNLIAFSIENTKPSNSKNQINSDRDGIGLQNIRKQLDLLYPNNYKLDINETSDLYSVILKITQNEV